MPSLTIKLMACVVASAFVAAAAAPAEAAKARKHKKVAAAHETAQTKYRGTDKVPAGPLYSGRVYLGDDPDPFIRSQIHRDINAIHGGND
jgi:hypothetical protein